MENKEIPKEFFEQPPLTRWDLVWVESLKTMAIQAKEDGVYVLYSDYEKLLNTK